MVVPIATAAAGVAGGVVLGRNAKQRNRKILGVPVPAVKTIDFGGMSKQLGGMGKQIGEAGRQFGKLAGEIQQAREKAEKVSKAIG